MLLMFKIALRNVTKRWLDVILVVMGTMVSTALITGSFVVNDSFTHYNLQKLDRYFGNVDVVISKSSIPFIAQNFDEAYVINLLEKENGFEKAIGTVQIDAIFENPLDPSKAISAKVMGINPQEIKDFIGKKLTINENQIILGEHLAKLLDLRTGDKVVVRNPLRTITLTVTGIGKEGILNYRGISGNSNGVGIVLSDVARNLNMIPKSNVTDIFVSVDYNNLKELQKFTGKIKKDLKGFHIYDVKNNLLKNPSNKFLGYFVILFGGFAISSACFLSSNFFTMLFNERKKDLSILKTFGFYRKDLFVALFIEGLIYVTISSASGAMIGLLISRFLLDGFKSIKMPFSDIFSISLDNLSFYVKPISIFYSIVIGILLPLVILFFYSRKFSRETVLNMMKQNHDSEMGVAKNYLIPTILTVIGTVFLFLGKGFTGFIGINIILLTFPFFFKIRVLYILFSIASMVFAYFSTIFYNGQDISEIVVNLIRGGFYMISSIILVVYSSYFIRKLFEFFLSRFPGGILSIRNGFSYVSANPKKTSFNMMIFGIMVFGMVVTLTVPYNIFGFISQKISNGFLGYDFAIVVNPIKNILNLREINIKDSEIKRVFEKFDRIILAPVKIKIGDEKPRNSIAAFINPREDEVPPIKLFDTLSKSDEIIWKNFQSSSQAEPFVVAGITSENSNSTELGNFVEMNIPRTIFQIQNPNLVLPKLKILATYKIQENFIPVEWILPMKVLPKNYKGGFVVYLCKTRSNDPMLINNLKIQITKDMNFPIYLTEEFGRIYESLNFFVNLGVSLLYFGLITGFSGLILTIIRSVNSRKRNIATLKAIGIRPSKISVSFIIESSFIVVCGILIGAISGLVESFDLVKEILGSFGQEGFTFPIVKLFFLFGSVYLLAFASSFLPSRMAARIPPAENLKTFD